MCCRVCCAGAEQEQLAREAGFAFARHYPIGFDLMGVLVATKGKAGR